MTVGIDFYKFRKAVNSTKTPDENVDQIHYSGTFKDGTNVRNPEIALDASGGITYYNYAYIPAFDRYYFVTNWTYDRRFWVASLTCDIMGSLKSIIGASAQYVERAYSAWDEFIIDGLYPGTALAPLQSQAYSAGYNSYGSFIVGVSGAPGGGSTGGGTTYFCLNPAQMNTLMQMLFDSTSYSGLSGENLFYFNPFQFITSVRWYPLTMLPSINQPIKLGFYELTSASPTAGEVYYTPVVTVTLPSHPQASTRGRFLNQSPYASYRLYIPGVGELPISSEALDQSDRDITIQGIFDPITGTIIYHLTNNGTEIAVATGNFGCDIAVSQVTVSPGNYYKMSGLKAFSDFGSFLENAFQAPAFSSDLAFSTHQAFSGVVDSLRTSMLQASISGSDGNRAMYYTSSNYILFSQFVLVANDNVVHNGRPLMQTRTISTLSGFVKTENAHLEGNGSFTLPELQDAEIIMNGGFYYE